MIQSLLVIEKSRFVEMAKFFRRSYFNKVEFQIRKYKILGDGHFNIIGCFFWLNMQQVQHALLFKEAF